MRNEKLRRHIAWDAARLMYSREESEYLRAKLKAAKRICRGEVKPSDLPSNAEIRTEINAMARMHEGEERLGRLQEMRFSALRLMQQLRPFKPRLIGSVLTGHIRAGSDIDIHLFSETLEAVEHALDQEGLAYEVQKKIVRKQGKTETFVHFHIQGRFPYELTVYSPEKTRDQFRCSITGKAIEKRTLNELRLFLQKEYPLLDLEEEIIRQEEEASVDPYQYFYSLLLPLEEVNQSLKYHPEGEALYHSLQVYDLAKEELPYDEEFLLAALLHDVGKAIDPENHSLAAVQELAGFITERTSWLIEHHMLAHKVRDLTIGSRQHRRLRESEYYHDLLLLGECDLGGRQVGVEVTELEDAIEELRNLSEMFGT